MCSYAAMFRWPNVREDIEEKSKTSSTCLNPGKHLKFQIPQTEKKSTKTPCDFTGNLHNKTLPSILYMLITLNKISRRLVVKMCKNTNHEIVNTFFNVNIFVYGVPKRIKADIGNAKEYNELSRSQNIDLVYSTANLHTGIGLVERTIQSLKNLKLAKLEGGLNLCKILNRALYVLRFTTNSKTHKTPFKSHFGRVPSTN